MLINYILFLSSIVWSETRNWCWTTQIRRVVIHSIIVWMITLSWAWEQSFIQCGSMCINMFASRSPSFRHIRLTNMPFLLSHHIKLVFFALIYIQILLLWGIGTTGTEIRPAYSRRKLLGSILIIISRLKSVFEFIEFSILKVHRTGWFHILWIYAFFFFHLFENFLSEFCERNLIASFIALNQWI